MHQWHFPFWLGGKGNRPIFDLTYLTVRIPFGEFEVFSEKIQETVSISRSSCFSLGEITLFVSTRVWMSQN